MTDKILVIERRLPHAQDKVWRAITTPELMADWLMPNDFKAAPGHRFTLRAEPQPNWNGLVTGEVLAVEPPSRLVMKWYDMTIVMTLTPDGEGTALRIEQSGFANEAAYNGANYGWTGFLAKLEPVAARA